MTATFYVGDVLDVLGKLPEKSVDLVLSSPPFLALRSYLPADHPLKEKEGGSQSTPGEYIDWLLDVVEACDRVLVPHGSICLELGDTYSGGAVGWTDEDRNNGYGRSMELQQRGSVKNGSGWPLPKSLSLIPESFRFAMVYGFNPFTGRQTERWRLRNVIRWVRPNPPVGALGDKFRPATSELMVFCKSAKRYFDLDAVRSPHTEPGADRQLGGRKSPNGGDWTRDEASGQNPAGAPPLDWWNVPLLEGEEPKKMGPKPQPPRTTTGGKQIGRNVAGNDADPNYRPNYEDRPLNPAGAPPLDWWNIPPGGYEGAHYAVMPKELCVKPIKAMSPSLVCLECGPIHEMRTLRPDNSQSEQAVLLPAMRNRLGSDDTAAHAGVFDPAGLHHDERLSGSSDGNGGGLHLPASPSDGGALGSDAPTDRGRSSQERNQARQPSGEPRSHGQGSSFSPRDDRTSTPHGALPSLRRASEFLRDCPRCGGATRLGRVLDPFAGSGTTGAVATGLGREAWLIDLDERNYYLALDRVGPLVLQRGEI